MRLNKDLVANTVSLVTPFFGLLFVLRTISPAGIIHFFYLLSALVVHITFGKCLLQHSTFF